MNNVKYVDEEKNNRNSNKKRGCEEKGILP